MIISTGNKKAKYIVKFYHSNITNKDTQIGRQSQCSIETFKTRKLVGVGHSIAIGANVKTRAKRRTEAFTDALSYIKDKKERTKIFKDYTSKCRIK